jgi:phosphoglycerol transferase MdoB-like AlkP superfamily enzyme
MQQTNVFDKHKGAPWAFVPAFFIRFILFWLALFLTQRLLFHIHYRKNFSDLDFEAYFPAYFKGISLDLAFVGFASLALVLVFLLWLLLKGKAQHWVKILLKVLFSVLVLLIVLIHAGEIGAYGDWNHKLSSRVFTHLNNPDEVFRTASFSHYLVFIGYVAVQLFIAWLLSKSLFSKLIRYPTENRIPALWSVSTCLLLIPIAFLMARGGWGSIPINSADGQFSKHQIVNDLCINSSYYFMENMFQSSKVDLEKYLQDINEDEALKLKQEIKTDCEVFPEFLDTIRPNIVMVVLESWVADAISHSGLIEGSTPHFDPLISEGLYFSNCYATSGTSEVGNASIFSGYPALPKVSLSLHQNQSRKVKALNQTLKDEGYFSSYLFGGDLKYGKIGAYFLDHNFDEIKDEKEFGHIKKRGALNIYDTDLLEQFLKDIDSREAPFLSVAFTGSTHSPWDVPKEWNDFYKGEEEGIINTIRFADHALGKFIKQAKQKPWFSNTLFIFVADHGRTCPSNSSHHSPAFFRIPLLFWGPVLNENFQGKQEDYIISQTDIATTLLAQMKLATDDYPYSRNVLCELYDPFAIYSSTKGYGIINPKGALFFDMERNDFSVNSFSEEQKKEQLRFLKRYLKFVYMDFEAL